jgi:cell division protein FtsQ
MKRPQGFERPAAPPPAATSRQPRSARPTPPSRPAASAPIGTNTGTGSEATTEPIAVQRHDPSSIAPVFPLRRPDDAGTPGSTPAVPPALTPAAARKQLRAAKRARKQYERDEVRRFTWRSRRRRNTWLVSFGVVAGLIAFVLAGAYSPLMALRTIDVVGAKRIPAAEIRAALHDQLGTPLPLIDSSTVRSELSQFRLIRSYVSENRPPGTLVVRIIEREPIGVIPFRAGFHLVDAAGVVITASTKRPGGYPALEAGAVGSAGFQAAAAVVTALPPAIRSKLRSVSAATKDDVTLTLAGGTRVVWGSEEKSAYKAVVLEALMVGHPAGDVGEYDVSSPDNAVVR